MENLKHKSAIYAVFEIMFEEWMDDKDKIYFMSMTLQKTGFTFNDLDEAFETGLQNGHSIELQIKLCQKVFSNT